MGCIKPGLLSQVGVCNWRTPICVGSCRGVWVCVRVQSRKAVTIRAVHIITYKCRACTSCSAQQHAWCHTSYFYLVWVHAVLQQLTFCQANQPLARRTVACPWGLMGKGTCVRVDLRTSLHVVLLYHASKHATPCPLLPPTGPVVTVAMPVVEHRDVATA